MLSFLLVQQFWQALNGFSTAEGPRNVPAGLRVEERRRTGMATDVTPRPLCLFFHSIELVTAALHTHPASTSSHEHGPLHVRRGAWEATGNGLWKRAPRGQVKSEGREKEERTTQHTCRTTRRFAGWLFRPIQETGGPLAMPFALAPFRPSTCLPSCPPYFSTGHPQKSTAPLGHSLPLKTSVHRRWADKSFLQNNFDKWAVRFGVLVLLRSFTPVVHGLCFQHAAGLF